MSLSLTGRAAIVTGASEGLGREIARAYVVAGASVLICARDGERLEQALADIRAWRGQLRRSSPSRQTSRIRRTSIGSSRVRSTRFGRCTSSSTTRASTARLGPIETVDWPAWVAGDRNQPVRIRPDGPRARAALQAPSIRQDRPVVRRRRHESAAARQRLCRVEGGGRQVRRIAGARAGGLRHRREFRGARRAEHPADGSASRRRAGHGGRRPSTIACGRSPAEGGTPLERGAALAVFLGSAESDGITGRLLSAVWDPLGGIAGTSRRAQNDGRYTLRRIVAGRSRHWTGKAKPR